MVTGVGGALLSIAYDPQRRELGASGAIFGIVGAVMAGVKFGDLNISTGEKRAIFSSVVSFAVLNFILGMSSGSVFGNIDNMCHLGGFVTGLLIGLPMGAFARNNKILQVVTLVITSAVLAAGAHELVQTHGAAARKGMAMRAAEAGDPNAAAYLEDYIRNNPADDEALTSLGTYYVLTNQPQKAVDAFQRALKANPASEEAKDALHGLNAPASPENK
jgi:hypothetical protein